MNALIKNRRRLFSAAMLAALAVLGSLPASARAQFLDPSTLHISSANSAGSDPVQLLGNPQTITVTQVQNGAADLANPWLLIVGVANDTAAGKAFNGVTLSVSSSSGGAASGALGGSNLYGGNWNLTGKPSGFAGLMTSSDAYTLIGGDLAGSNNSNSFTNWAGADSIINGITAQNFGLYVFEINATLAAQGSVSITFNGGGGLPVGAYVIGFGEDSKHIYSTPFTEAGLETGNKVLTPAPPSAILAGLGGLGIGLSGLFKRYRRAGVIAA
jgi:hypothetical protein